MKPFSALYYIKNNFKRSIVISIMMNFVMVCFMGGMYLDNISESFFIRYDKPAEYAWVYVNTSNNGGDEETGKFRNKIDSYLTKNVKEYMEVGYLNCQYMSIMGFNNNSESFIFYSVEDFEKYKKYTTDYPDDVKLSDGEILMSELLANNIGLRDGDIVHYDKDAGKCQRVGSHKVNSSFVRLYNRDLKVKIVNMKGIWVAAIDSTYNNSDNLLFLGGEGQGVSDDLNKIADSINSEFKNVRASTNEIFMKDLDRDIGFMYSVLGLIIGVVSVVLAVTINATVAATYEKRKFEFSIYKALGYNKKSIFKKVCSETLIMNAAGVIFGCVFCAIVFAVLNENMYEQGFHFYYISVNGIKAAIICDICVLIPVIFFNYRRTNKYDVTVY